MHHARAFGCHQRLGALQEQPHRVFGVQGVVADERSQAFAIHVLHGQEGADGRVLTYVVDGDDVRVVQPRGNLGLALEADQGVVLRVAGLLHHLDGQPSLQ